ncbi:MAG: hypothetical protein KC645_17185 [Gemmatimonadetes bacterium]|nr:hypothetical protein [Gemmatimonadota bacterium]
MKRRDVPLAGPLSAALLCTALAAPLAGQTAACTLDGYSAGAPVLAEASAAGVRLTWDGTDGARVRMALERGSSGPRIVQWELADAGADFRTIARDVGFDLEVVEGYRRISNQQLVPLRELGVELTSDVVDRYKWDVFWDAPLDLAPPAGGGMMSANPPPADGVAHQPGLPRRPEEIRRGRVAFTGGGCAVESEGRRLRVRFPGLAAGSFQGELVLTAYAGTSLLRVEAIASTTLPSVAYKYDLGLSGLPVQGSRVHWRDLSNRPQSYGLRGPVNDALVPLRAANRVVVAETGGAAIAAFPPPHTFFWAREVEIVVGNDWYRKDGPDVFSFGVRQGEAEVVERYRANWSLYSAPPGTEQHMAAYFLPVPGDGEAAFTAALAFTNGDVYPTLPGYKVLGSHYHTDVGRTLMASGSVDTRLPDFEALRAAGIDIAGPVDRPRDETQLEEQRWLFEGARRHSDDRFLVLPEMENSNLLGGHWDLFFSHPVHYVDTREPGTPLVTEHPEYGRVYNIGSVDDMRAMIEAEDMLVFMPHPRTKGSTGYPDAIRQSPQFLSDWYRGVGWRWGMGSDLSEERLSGTRVIPLLDDMNNWIADSDLRLKGLVGITETYAKAPGDDIYANGPVTYLRLDRLPAGDDYAPVVRALREGDYFVTSGEVLIPEHRYEGQGDTRTLVADVRWSFPLAFVEVVTGDGERTTTHRVEAADLPAFGTHTFRIPFAARGQAWVRFAAWDTAGNGAMTMPVRLER